MQTLTHMHTCVLRANIQHMEPKCNQELSNKIQPQDKVLRRKILLFAFVFEINAHKKVSEAIPKAQSMADLHSHWETINFQFWFLSLSICTSPVNVQTEPEISKKKIRAPLRQQDHWLLLYSQCELFMHFCE